LPKLAESESPPSQKDGGLFCVAQLAASSDYWTGANSPDEVDRASGIHSLRLWMLRPRSSVNA
jgi:hypothetical protein